MDKYVTSGALKKTIDLTKDNLAEHDTRLQNIENATSTELQCENVVTQMPANIGNNLKLTSVQGKTLQNVAQLTYAYEKGLIGGANNFASFEDGYITIDDTTADKTYYVSKSSKLNLLKPSTTYTFIIEIQENTLNDYYRTSTCAFTSGWKLFDAKQTGIVKVALTTLSDLNEKLDWQLRTNAETTGKLKFRFMLLEGDWTNKETPSYFEGIQSVQNPLDVQVTGKNLFDGEFPHIGYYADSTGGLYPATDRKTSGFIEVKPNTTYTLSVNGNLLDRVNEFSEPTQNSGLVMSREYSAKKECTFTTTHKTKYIQFNVRTASDVEVMLECNTTATAYEPYKQPIDYKLPFDGELRSLPNGVADEIKDGKLIRWVGKHIITGSSIANVKSYETGYFRFTVTDTPKNIKRFIGTKNNILTNRLLEVKGDDLYAGNCAGISQFTDTLQLFCGFPTSVVSEVTETNIKKYLDENPLEAYFTLATPEIIELETIYNNPVYKAYVNGNIIQNNAPIHPTLTFAYQTGLQGKISDLQVEVEQHESELRNMLANETGLQTVTERVNDLVMQDGNIKLEELQGNTVQNHSQVVAENNNKVNAEGYYMYDMNEQTFQNFDNGTTPFLPLKTLDMSKTYTVIYQQLKQEDGNGNELLGEIILTDNTNTNVGTFTVTQFHNNTPKLLNTRSTSNYIIFRGLRSTAGAYTLDGNGFRFMILEGDWTNREIPAYFTGIKSVNEEQTGLQVRSVGKNLFNVHEFVRKMNTAISTTNRVYSLDEQENLIVTGLDSRTEAFQYAITVKPNTSYTVSVSKGEFTPRIYNVTSETKASLLASGATNTTFTFTTKEHTKIGIKFVNTDSPTYPYIFGKVQIEEGSVATEYEPYKESAITIPYAEPLRKLPNGVADTVEDRKVIRRVGKIVYDGTGWETHSNTNDETFWGVCWTKLEGNANLSNNTEEGDWGSVIVSNLRVGIDTFYFVTGYPIIKFPITQIADINALKTWMNTNPITVYYQLATPIVEEIPEITLAGYKHLILDNDIVPTSATVSFANSNYARLVALEESNVANSKTINDLCAVVDVLTLQIGNIGILLDSINGEVI